MSGFEEKGAERIYNSKSIYEMEKNFRNSCYVCCYHGINNISCDRCGISYAHNFMKDFFMEELRKKA